MNMKDFYKYVVLAVAFASFKPCALQAGILIRERLWAPIETLKESPRLPTKISIIPSYGKTFQKSGNKDRLTGILPFLYWGVLDAVVIGGTPGIGEGGGNFVDGKGILGAGGGVSVDRILTAMFPEMGDYFSGTVPGTSLTFAVKAGIGEVWDFSQSEPAALAYLGPQISF